MNSDALAARIENLLGSSPSSIGDKVPSRPPPPIPDHEIITRIGGGSYGEVWLARSITGALRAVKTVWRSHFASERPYEREFHGIVRFEPISRSHPGVVNVLHVGRDDAAGCFFYVMELADDSHGESEQVGKWGSENVPRDAQKEFSPAHYLTCSPANYSPRTLASELKSRTRLPVIDAVSLGVQLAGALGHLHRHGLVHRDVKPSNVIFVHGQPKLADIGLVTGVHEEHSFVGTEGFIPPEGPGSERADLFALGRLLYEAATGKNRCDFPGLPDDLDRWPKNEREALIELNEVLARACAPDAKSRHSNAAELAGDLNLILAGRSVRRAYRIERQLRRATLVSVAALVLVFAAIFSNWLQRRQRELSEAHARREAALREETQKSLARAEAAERESLQQLYSALLEQARATVLSGEVGQRVRALDALRRAAAISNSAELRREVFAALALPDLRFEREPSFGADATFATLDPEFKRLAVNHGRGPTEIRAVSDNRLMATLPASTNLSAFVKEWSPDGRFLSVKRDLDSGGRHGDYEVWNVAEQRRVLLLRGVAYRAFSFHPRLPRVIARRNTEDVRLWNLEDARELARFQLAGQAVILRFAPEGKRFAAISAGSRLSLHAVMDPDAAELASHTFKEAVNTVAWHPDGRALAIPDHGGAVHWVDTKTGEIELLGRHKYNAVEAVFSPEGAYLFTAGWGQELICWDVRTKRRAFTASLISHRIQFSADGRRCAVGTKTSLQLHTFEQPTAHREFAEDLGVRLRLASISADGRWLAASDAKRAAVWDLSSGGPGVIETNAYDMHFYFTPDGRELFGSRRNQGDTAGFRWRLTPATNPSAPPGLTRLPLRGPKDVMSLSLISNSLVMTGTNGSQILAPEEIEAGRERWAPTFPGINGVSPDGRWLGIFRPFGSSLYIYRLPGFEQIAKLTRPTYFGNFHFSPVGDEVAITSDRTGVEFWSTATWARTRSLTNFIRLLYTPDTHALWLTKDLRNAGLYNASTLEPLLLLPTGMLPLALSPDGQRVAVSVDAQRLQLWDLAAVRKQLRELGSDWP